MRTLFTTRPIHYNNYFEGKMKQFPLFPEKGVKQVKKGGKKKGGKKGK